jgi:hypothetical protein
VGYRFTPASDHAAAIGGGGGDGDGGS